MNAIPAGTEYGLVADVGGALTRVAIQVTPSLLSGQKDPKQLEAYRQLLDHLPAGLDIAVLADATDLRHTREWLNRVAPKGVFTTIPTPQGALSRTGWIRDMFLCTTRKNVKTYIKTRTGKLDKSRQDAEQQADWLAAIDGTTLENREVHLDGGDCLVGGDFWMVGANSVHETARINAIAYEDAIRLISEIDDRKLCIVGFRRRDLQSWSGWIPNRSAGPDRLHQNWEHMDLVLALTGVGDASGKQIVLVASTTLAPSKSLDAEAQDQNDALDALEIYLTEIGYSVRRNPAPYSGPPGTPKRIFPYNNVIVQNDPNIVWLPHFALDDATFADVDAENDRIWRELGFEVVPVPGWHAFLRSDGSIRCATKTLARASAAQKTEILAAASPTG